MTDLSSIATVTVRASSAVNLWADVQYGDYRVVVCATGNNATITFEVTP